MEQQPLLLAVMELGGYPDFSPLYQRAGYRVTIERSVRRAISSLNKACPAVLVGEFNFQSDFRDRTSSLDSLLAAYQRVGGGRAIIFFEKEHEGPFGRLRARFPIHAALPFPIDQAALLEALADPAHAAS